MPNPTTPVTLDRTATHVDVTPGGEIILRGSFTSTHDGSTVDAATTSWPKDAPGGAGTDAGGILDLQAGGFHVTSRDPVSHEVHAVATGDAAPACAVAGVAAPCLPLRLREPAQKRLLTANDWAKSLKGGLSVEVVAPPVYAPAVTAASAARPFLLGGGALLAVLLSCFVLWKAYVRRATSPRAQLLALARRVHGKAQGADPILAAPLTPALAGALRKLESGGVDPSSAEGKRVRVMLEKVDSRLDEAAHKAKSQKEQAVADELAREVEVAFEAAEEALVAERR